MQSPRSAYAHYIYSLFIKSYIIMPLRLLRICISAHIFPQKELGTISTAGGQVAPVRLELLTSS